MQNPATLGMLPPNTGSATTRKLRSLKNKGHDGVIVEYGADGKRMYIAFRPEQIKSAAGNNGNFDATDANIRHSKRDQIETPKFANWYGDWQNAKDGSSPTTADNTGPGVDGGGDRNVDPVQRPGDLGADRQGPVTVGKVRFTGTTGPLGEDGKPVGFYHGTREDFSVFQADHPTRADFGWLGRGIYTTSSSDLAGMYAEYVKRGSGMPSTMPLWVNVRNPYVAANTLKAKLKNASQEQIDQGSPARAGVAAPGFLVLWRRQLF